MKAELFRKLSLPLDALAEILVYRRKPKNVKAVYNLKYSEAPRSEFDLYYIDDGKPKGVLLYIHGGGFVSGDKRMRRYHCYEYAKKGYLVMNANYEYAQFSPFPRQIAQLLKAVEYLFDNKDALNIDVNNIILSGESAGAYFAAYMSALSVNRGLYDELNFDFRYKDEFKPRRNVLICGAYSADSLVNNKFPNSKMFAKVFSGLSLAELKSGKGTERMNILNYISEDYPPSLVAHAKRDPLRRESAALIKAFEKNNVRFLEYRDDTIPSFHAFMIATYSKAGKGLLEKAFDFIKE